MDASGSIWTTDAWKNETALIRSSVASIGNDDSIITVLAFNDTWKSIVSNMTRGEAVDPASAFTPDVLTQVIPSGGTNIGDAIKGCQASVKG